MLAGKPVQRMTVVGTFHVTNSTRTIPEGGLTVVIFPMVAAAGGTNFGIIYGFDNFLRIKFFNPTVLAERIMV